MLNSNQDINQFYRKLYEDFSDKVFKTCIGFTHNTEDAEDLVQEVFVEVYNSIDKFRNDSKLSTWIYRIAVNKSLNYIQKNKKFKLNMSNELLFNFKSQNASPSEKIENKDLSEILNKALNSLKEKQRIAFVLCKYDDLSYNEISEIMGVSVSSVESLIHRAKINLQNKILNFHQGKY